MKRIHYTSWSDVPIKHKPVKRFFDLLFSLSLLIILFPFMVLISLAIFCTSRGNIFYFQERIGRGGTPFTCYKFRTMYADADARLAEILSKDAEARLEWQCYRKLKNDPRITLIGFFLRRTSMDEFPQFLNVLKGDLSVVGPRPVVQEEIEQHFGHKAYKIFSIRPGITGLWQISGRNDVHYSSRIALDEHYVDRSSILLDLKIMALTLPSMINSKGAY